MQTTDELNSDIYNTIEQLKAPRFVAIGKYNVPRITRGQENRILAAIAPFFSVFDEANPGSLFEVMYSPEFEDTVIASALGISMEELLDMDAMSEYEPILATFNEINPNFLSDIATKEAARASLKFVLLHNT